MTPLKRIANGTSAAILTLSSLMSLGFTGVAHATVNNCTWTGATSNNFNTSTNWSGCNSTVPQTGDNLVFDITSLSAAKTLTNNITGLSVNNITFQGTNASYYGYTITGNSITLTGNIAASQNTYQELGTNLVLTANTTVDVTNASGGLSLSGNISGTGNLNKTGAGSVSFDGVNSFTGDITLSAGGTQISKASGFGQASNTVTVANGADLSLADCNGGFTLPNALTLTGASSAPSGNNPIPKLGAYGTCAGGGGGGGDEEYGTVAGTAQYGLSGAVTLGSDVTFGGYAKSTTLTGTLSGNFKFNLMPKYYGGSLVVASSSNTSGIANGTYAPPTDNETLSDNQPTNSVQIDSNAIVTIDGQRGDVYVNGNSTLKGIGQVNSLTLSGGGILAPGHSPGTLKVVTILTLFPNTTYQAELKNTAAGSFDQVVVGSASDTTGNDVILGDGTPADGMPTLDTELYDGYSIKAGDTFEIINNLSQTAVKGSFNGLPEGATFKVGNGVFKISYVGGDGNDVVLTAVTAPTTPDTGFALMSAHPGATLGLTAAAAGLIFAVARTNKRKLAPAHARVSKRRK